MNKDRLFSEINDFYSSSFKYLNLNKFAQTVAVDQYEHTDDASLKSNTLNKWLNRNGGWTKELDELQEERKRAYSVNRESKQARFAIFAKSLTIGQSAINVATPANKDNTVKFVQLCLVSIIQALNKDNFIADFIKNNKSEQLVSTSMAKVSNLGLDDFLKGVLNDTLDESVSAEAQIEEKRKDLSNAFVNISEPITLSNIKPVNSEAWNIIQAAYNNILSILKGLKKGDPERARYVAIIKLFDTIAGTYAYAIHNDSFYPEASSKLDDILEDYNTYQIEDSNGNIDAAPLFTDQEEVSLKNPTIEALKADLAERADVSGIDVDDVNEFKLGFLEDALAPEEVDELAEHFETETSGGDGGISQLPMGQFSTTGPKEGKNLLNRIQNRKEHISYIFNSLLKRRNIDKSSIAQNLGFVDDYNKLISSYPALEESVKKFFDIQSSYNAIENKTPSDTLKFREAKLERDGLLRKEEALYSKVRASVLSKEKLDLIDESSKEKDPIQKRIKELQIMRIDNTLSTNVFKKDLSRAITALLKAYQDPDSTKMTIYDENGKATVVRKSVTDLEKDLEYAKKSVVDRKIYNKQEAELIRVKKTLGTVDGIMVTIYHRINTDKSDLLKSVKESIIDYVRSGLAIGEEKYNTYFKIQVEEINALNDEYEKLKITADSVKASAVEQQLEQAINKLNKSVENFLNNPQQSGWDFPAAFNSAAAGVIDLNKRIKGLMNDYNKFKSSVNGKPANIVAADCDAYADRFRSIAALIETLTNDVYKKKGQSQIHALIYNRVFFTTTTIGGLHRSSILDIQESINDLIDELREISGKLYKDVEVNVSHLAEKRNPYAFKFMKEEDRDNDKDPFLGSAKNFRKEKQDDRPKPKEKVKLPTPTESHPLLDLEKVRRFMKSPTTVVPAAATVPPKAAPAKSQEPTSATSASPSVRREITPEAVRAFLNKQKVDDIDADEIIIPE